METEIKETQEKSARNQISIEIAKCDLAEVAITTETNSTDIIRLEKNIVSTNQYNRRPNLVIEGIPDDVPQSKLEVICLNIIHDIGFAGVSSYEVVGCHRLKRRDGDSTTPTIIRFVNRKITEFCLKNKWRLKHLRSNWNLNFRDDLCDNNLDILSKCENLQKEGKLIKVFTYNGFVKVVRRTNERPIKVMHITDLDKLAL